MTNASGNAKTSKRDRPVKSILSGKAAAKITSSMIDAGMKILQGEFPESSFGDESERKAIGKIYKKMLAMSGYNTEG